MKRRSGTSLLTLFTLVVLVAGASFAAACDPGASLTWVNETDQTTYVVLGDDPDNLDVVIPPHSTLEGVGTVRAVWRDVVVIRDEGGNVLYREEITWDELKAQGFTFVITEEDISQYSPD